MTLGPIISLSLPKSGTTTLANALRQAGLKVADWRIRRHETDTVDLHDKLIAPLMYEDYFDSGDPLRRLGEFQAITEMNAINYKVNLWPQKDPGMLDAIARHHPTAKFILSRRDPGQTAHSILNWNNLGKERLPKRDVPGLPIPYGNSMSDLTRWIEGHYTFCDRFFQGSDAYFSYELEEPDVRSKLSYFLQLPLPWWGKSNTTSDWIETQRQEG